MSRVTLWIFVAVVAVGCLFLAILLGFVYVIAGHDSEAGIVLLAVPCISPLVIGCGIGAVTLAMSDAERKFNRWERTFAWVSGCLTVFGIVSVVAFFH